MNYFTGWRNYIIDEFFAVGLHLNASKTKVLTPAALTDPDSVDDIQSTQENTSQSPCVPEIAFELL